MDCKRDIYVCVLFIYLFLISFYLFILFSLLLLLLLLLHEICTLISFAREWLIIDFKYTCNWHINFFYCIIFMFNFQIALFLLTSSFYFAWDLNTINWKLRTTTSIKRPWQAASMAKVKVQHCHYWNYTSTMPHQSPKFVCFFGSHLCMVI